jgi:predicted anti-sigma-YlaC factor YlaD
MSCKEIKEQFDERLDGRLSESQQSVFDEHLTACAECRREWQAYAGAWATLERHVGIEPSFGFVERTLRRLAEQPVARKWFLQPGFRWATLVASVFVLGVCAWVGHERLVEQRRVEIYTSIRQADYLEDFDVIASLDQLNSARNGANKL